MAEEKALNTENEVATPSKPKKKGGGFKEWLRKKVVALKRAPQTIPLLVLAVTTVYYMFIIFTISMSVTAAAENEHTFATGLCVFITALLSLLVLVSFLNAFPKRKKANIFFIVLVFVMIGAMVACDLVYYIQMNNCMNAISNPETSNMYAAVKAGQPYVLVHVILLGVSALVFALLPAYKILINKINTKVELESATENMHGGIDIEED